MERQNINNYIENHKKEVGTLIFEPTVEKEIGMVEIDWNKAFILLLPLLNGELWSACTNNAANAVSAVYAAFDAHDKINLKNSNSKQQQLIVLSGDHFSGIHYRLLASQSNFSFIHSLSKMIGSINEMKTIVHGQIPSSSEKVIEAFRVIETGCIVTFYKANGFSRYIPIAESVLTLKKLLDLSKTNIYDRDSQIHLAIDILLTKVQTVLDQTDFLNQTLRDELYGMYLPLHKKFI